jgi:ssDNA-binding Zn-finger/Zn-ribbon topoisomerase 1
MLESFCHPYNSFLTLTYENVPLCGSVCPTHLRNFLKKLRKRYYEKTGDRIRYYAVAEYGGRFLRPHYHLALFNYPSCYYGEPRNSKFTRGKTPKQIVCDCPNCQFLYDVWQKGITFNGRLEPKSAQYIASYIVDKVTVKNPVENGRFGEFNRMSTDPGIGLGNKDHIGLDFLVDFFKSDCGEEYLETHGDVPHTINHGGKPWPLGDYLRRKLRERLERDVRTPSNILDQVDQERRDELNKWRSENPDLVSFTRNDKLDTYQMNIQKMRNKEAKFNLYQKRKDKL